MTPRAPERQLRAARRLEGAVFLASLAVIALQVAAMQALAEAQGHHFAYIVISLALLGFGSSGAALALARDALLARARWLMPATLLAAGLACLFGLPGAQAAAARTDFQLLFVDWRAWRPLLGSAALVFLPFFFAALFIGLVFVRDAGAISRRYAANLLGSASGAGVGLVLLHRFEATRLFPACACFLALAAGLATPPSTSGGRGRRAIRHLPTAGLLLLGALGLARMPDIPASAYKGISASLRLPGARIVRTQPHPLGRVRLVESPALRHGPGLSLRFAGEVPAAPQLYRNGDDYGAWPEPVAAGEKHIRDASVHALPLALATAHRAAVLHAGGGAAVGHLLARGVPFVQAVEPHPVVAQWLHERYRGFVGTGRLAVATREGRAFLASPAARGFDLILLPAQGAFGGGLGVQALQEDYLLTIEAFRAMWRALSADGLLSFSVYLDAPPRRSLKLVALLAATLRAEGVAEPSAHVAAVRGWDMLTVVGARRAFDAPARARLHDFAMDNGFDRAWIPGAGPERTARFHVLDDDRLEAGFEALLTGKGAPFLADYPFALAAPRDSRPYFHQFIRWRRLDAVRRAVGFGSLAFVEMGSILVGATAVALTLASLVLIVLPLVLRLGWRPGGRLAVFATFAGLGLGFMFLEIVWIQRFTLFWGHSLYSAAGVLAALLCGMGLGSALSARLPANARPLRLALGGIVGLALVSSALLPTLLELAMAWPGALKCGFGLALLAGPAVLLGLPFPLALRAVNEARPWHVPWALGINGCFSVLAAPLATLLAMSGGFALVGVLAAAAYLLAFMASASLGARA